MTVEELIAAAKTLPSIDQDRIVAVLTEGKLKRIESEFAASLRPDFVAELWVPQHDPATSKAIEQELKKLEAVRS